MTHTRKMAWIAILSAVSFLLMYLKFPLIPTASFLEVDFSIIPILLGLIILDLKSAFAIMMVRTVLKFLLNNNGPSTVIGLPMNIAAVGVFVLAMAFIWNKQKTTKNYIIASLVGSVGSTLIMLVLNYVYAVPVYAAFADFDISKILGIGNYLFAMVLPFNLLQGVIFSVVFYAVYRLLGARLKKIAG